ncbi:MAG: UdgX family uracil-DNA binding protein [Pseudomonadota bacterium]
MGVMNDPLTTDLFPQALLPVTLQGATDLDGFRRASRALLARQMLPEQIVWSSGDEATPDLFGAQASGEQDTFHYLSPQEFAAAPAISVPPEFLTLCQAAILHSDPARFGLLYRILWRLAHEPGLRHDPLDADMMRAQQMAHAVRRDMHKMKAFVRFRSVQDETFNTHPEGGPLHVAWFEPEHHIVEAVAPFFARRFAQMRWAILTPERSVEWLNAGLDEPLSKGAGQDAVMAGLRFGPGARKEDAPMPDAGEQLWLTYYRNIFNPARLKVKMMQKEMPRKYWKNLPEAEMIHTLVAGAHESSIRMIEQPGSVPLRRIPVIPIADVTHAPVSAFTHAADGKAMKSLSAVRQATEHCRECPIGECATQSVAGEGPVGARLMFVGEQPGDHEDVRGKPFVGPAGQLLDRALAELGIARDGVFVSNAVKHFKYELRGKRRIHKTPTQREAAACQHWLDDEIRIVKPQLLVALGATAARSLLGRPVPVMASRGQIFEREDGLKVLVTLHPSALLRLPPDAKDEAWSAWLADLAHLKAQA